MQSNIFRRRTRATGKMVQENDDESTAEASVNKRAIKECSKGY